MPENLLNISEGIPKSLLDQITVTENDVVSGKSFLGSDGLIRVGNIPDLGQYQWTRGFGSGTNPSNSRRYITLNNIPEGLYRKNGEDWAPEIRADEEELLNWFGYAKSKGRVRVLATTYLGTRGSTPFGHCDINIYNADTGALIGAFSGDSTSMNGPGSNSETTCSL